MKRPLIIVFAKNPELGKVKTRLAKTIGVHKALKIYHQLLQKTASVLSTIDCTVCVYKTDNKENIPAFDNLAIRQVLQQGDDLGERMLRAFDENFSQYSPIIFIGTDLWTLEAEDILTSLHALKTHDVVLGPSEDGGYYLLGLKHPLPALFKNKQWGTSTVFNDTRNDIQDEKVYLLSLKNDIDMYVDLIQYPELIQTIE